DAARRRSPAWLSCPTRAPRVPPPHPQSTYVFFAHHAPAGEIYTRSLHDALPIFRASLGLFTQAGSGNSNPFLGSYTTDLHAEERSEEHTSELQSRENRVCRLLLEKKKQRTSGTRAGPCSVRSRQRRGPGGRETAR